MPKKILEDKKENNAKFLRIKSVTGMYSISRSSVYNFVNSGKIRAIKISEAITVYSVAELDALFNGEVAWYEITTNQ